MAVAARKGGVHWLRVPQLLFTQSLLSSYSFGTSAAGTGRLAGSSPAAFASAQIAFGTRAASAMVRAFIRTSSGDFTPA
jgi:hypothetical protein